MYNCKQLVYYIVYHYIDVVCLTQKLSSPSTVRHTLRIQKYMTRFYIVYDYTCTCAVLKNKYIAAVVFVLASTNIFLQYQ